MKIGGSGGGTDVSSGAASTTLAKMNPFKVLNKVLSIIREQGWTGVGKAGFGTVFISTIFLGLDFLRAIVTVPITLLQSMAGDLAILNSAFIAGPAEFLYAALSAGAGSFGTGWTGLLGPVQGPFGLALTGIMVWEGLYILDVTNSDFFGFVMDLPFFESDESGVDGEEGE